MKYSDFKVCIQNFPVFSSSHLPAFGGNEKLLRNQISYWKKQGLILELRKGLYILNEDDRKIFPSRLFLANQIYPPSYVSTEYALGFYDLIPERVVDVTSVTTRKTARFENPFGLFLYQYVNIPCFEGFIERKGEERSFLSNWRLTATRLKWQKQKYPWLTGPMYLLSPTMTSPRFLLQSFMHASFADMSKRGTSMRDKFENIGEVDGLRPGFYPARIAL